MQMTDSRWGGYNNHLDATSNSSAMQLLGDNYLPDHREVCIIGFLRMNADCEPEHAGNAVDDQWTKTSPYA